MLHKLKPVPRALIIIGIVGGIGYGLTTIEFSKPAPPSSVAIEAPPVTVVAPPATQPPAPAPVAEALAPPALQPAQASQQPAPGLTPSTKDAGLDAVLRATK